MGVAGACLVAVFAGEISSLFEGSGQELFNASVLLVAVGMLTWHNVWMASHGRAMAQEMRQVGADVAAGERANDRSARWRLSVSSGRYLTVR